MRIRATSLAGNGSWTEPTHFYVQDSKPSSYLYKKHGFIEKHLTMGDLVLIKLSHNMNGTVSKFVLNIHPCFEPLFKIWTSWDVQDS